MRGTPNRTSRPRTVAAAVSQHNSSSSSSSVTSSSGRPDNIKVYVRLRAFSEKERQGLLTQPSNAKGELAVRMKCSTVEVSVPQRGRFPFTFDDCFWSNDRPSEDDKPFVDQRDVFVNVGQPLVHNALAGFNSAIIAYGQTGSGKTYSIFGPQDSLGTDHEGLIPRVCDELFQRVRSAQRGTVYTVHASLMEVYLEEVFDLLSSRRKLAIRGDSINGFHVTGIRQVIVHSSQEILQLLGSAEGFKTYAQTAIHERSSRAHTIFQLEIRCISESSSRSSRLVLADLAGCERIKLAKTETGTALEQACNINLSLLTLGTCIEAVVSRGKAGKSCEGIGEFRQSALTKLLKDYIGGNSRTAILVTIAPSLQDASLTLQALRFADRAKQIQNHASINQHLVSHNNHIVTETIRQVYEQRKALLDREFDMELVQVQLQRKETDLERAAALLHQERCDLLERRQLMKENDSRRRDADDRVVEIEQKLRALQRELSDAQGQRTDLDAKFLAVTSEHASLYQDRENLERQVSELRGTLQLVQEEHEDDMLLQRVEDQAARKKLESVIHESQAALGHLKSVHQGEMSSLTRHFVEKFSESEKAHTSTKAALEDRELQSHHDSKIAEAQRVQLTSEMVLLDMNIQAANNEILELRVRLGEADKSRQREVASLHSDIVEREKATALWKVQCLSAMESVSSVSAQYAAILSASIVISSLKLNLFTDCCTKWLTSRTKHNRALLEEIDCQRQQTESLQAAFDFAHESRQELQVSCDELTEKLGHVTASCAALQTEEASLTCSISQLRGENEDLVERLSQERHQQEELCAVVRSLEDEKVRDRAALSQLKNQHQAEFLKISKAHEEEMVATTNNARKCVNHERNNLDLLVQQCMAAQRALHVGLSQCGFQQNANCVADRTPNNTSSPTKRILMDAITMPCGTRCSFDGV